MTRIVFYTICSDGLEKLPEDREYERRGVWEDGEWVEQSDYPMPVADELTADELTRRFDGPTLFAVSADEAPV